MNLDDEIFIEDRYGKNRNINDLLDIDDLEVKENNQTQNFLINQEKASDPITFDDLKIPTTEEKVYIVESTNKFRGFRYIVSIVLSVASISLFSIIIILLKGDIRNTIWGALRIPLEVIVFMILSLYIIRSKKQIPKVSGMVCALVGLFAGIFISIFKIFYHKELWTIFNTISESIFLLLMGFILGLVFGGLFYSADISLKYKYGSLK